MITKKERNLEYEKKFRSYLFKGDYDRFKEIVKNHSNSPEELARLVKESVGFEIVE